MSGPASRVDDVGLGNLVRTIVKDGWAPPQLLRAWRQLIVDFLAVWTGVRPTFMIDYCRGTAESWWEVLVQLAEHFGLPGDGLANLAVLTLDDCCYVADRRALRSHLSTCMRDVRFIAFPAEGPHWAERTEEGRRLQEKLGNSVREVLLPLLEDNPVPSPSSAARAVIDLSTAAAFIVMPILNGLLLGYPVVYLLRHDNVAQAARALTNADVQVVSVECRCLPSGPSATAFTLTACSAPCDLCPEGGQDAVGLPGPREPRTRRRARNTCFLTSPSPATCTRRGSPWHSDDEPASSVQHSGKSRA